LLGILLLSSLVACSEPSSPEAQQTARQALEAMIAGDAKTVEQYVAPGQRRPLGTEDSAAFSGVSSLAFQACRGLHVDYSDHSISDPAGARLVTATFTHPCVSTERVGRTKKDIGIVVVPIEGRWYVARLQ
jgi:hypothetical protein